MLPLRREEPFSVISRNMRRMSRFDVRPKNDTSGCVSAHMISQRHHARVTGKGLSQGESTSRTLPMLRMESLNVVFHHSCGIDAAMF